MTFCLCCEKKLIAQYGEDAFIGGCVFCKKLCCCVNKEDMNYTCLNGNEINIMLSHFPHLIATHSCGIPLQTSTAIRSVLSTGTGSG